MAEKVSLEKNDVDMKEINKKLDLLLNEVDSIKSELYTLKKKNDEQVYKLDSQVYNLCSDLKGQIYKLQNEVYSSNLKLGDSHYRVQKEIEELQKQTSYSKFIDKVLPWSPLILIGGSIWLIVLRIFFE